MNEEKLTEAEFEQMLNEVLGFESKDPLSNVPYSSVQPLPHDFDALGPKRASAAPGPSVALVVTSQGRVWGKVHTHTDPSADEVVGVKTEVDPAYRNLFEANQVRRQRLRRRRAMAARAAGIALLFGLVIVTGCNRHEIAKAFIAMTEEE